MFIVSIETRRTTKGIASQETCHIILNSQLSGEKRGLYNALAKYNSTVSIVPRKLIVSTKLRREPKHNQQ